MKRIILLTAVLVLFCSVVGYSSFRDNELEISDNWQQVEKRILLESSATYQIEVGVKGNIVGPALRISGYVTDENGERLLFSQVVRAPGVTNDWEYQTVTLTAPQKATYAKLVFSAPFLDDNGWNDVKITRVQQRGEQEDVFYTGLVIDARGLGLQRGMSPRVWSESGELVYGGIAAKKDFIQETGIASYGDGLTSNLLARLRLDSDLSFVSPLTVQAEEVVGNTNNSVIISDEAAEKILTAINSYDFLAEYAVVFLVNK